MTRPRLEGLSHLHPQLLAVFNALVLWAQNFDEVSVTDVVPIALAALLFSVLVSAATARLYRVTGRAAVAASFIVIATFAYVDVYDQVQDLVQGHVRHIRYRYGLIALATVVASGLWWLRRARLDDHRVNAFLGRFAAALVAACLGWLAVSWSTSGSGGPVESIRPGPSGEAVTVERPARPRDVYYLVFDRYASNETLSQHYGYDNTSFYDRLRQRGFYCAPDSRANYPKTAMSMASALNMRFLDAEIEGIRAYFPAVMDNRVVRLFKQMDYEVHHLGNWYEPLRTSPHADVNFRISPLPSELADVFYHRTPLGHLMNYTLSRTYGDPRLPLGKFSTLAEVARQDEATFAYAHFLLPHAPFIFDRQGSLVPRSVRKSGDNRELYIDQLIFANQRILGLVDEILAVSDPEPIIVIQADEGPFLDDEDQQNSRVTSMRKRTGIISAFLLPGIDVASVVPPQVTPVNTFRIVFSTHFGADLERYPDRVFYWQQATREGNPAKVTGNRFVDVTEDVSPPYRAGD